jgi:hypothetical protein
MSVSGDEEQIKTVYIRSPDPYPRHWCPQVVWPVELEHIMTTLRREEKQTREEIIRYDDGVEEESSDMQLYLEGYRRGIERVVMMLGDVSRKKPASGGGQGEHP